MATVNCPHRHRWISKRGNITFEFRDVRIFYDVCDSCDRCGFSGCEYFDESREATERFNRGLVESHGTIEMQVAQKEYERQLRIRLHNLYGTSKMPA